MFEQKRDKPPRPAVAQSVAIHHDDQSIKVCVLCPQAVLDAIHEE